MGAYEKNSHLVVHEAGYCFWNGEGHEMLKQKSSAQLEVLTSSIYFAKHWAITCFR